MYELEGVSQVLEGIAVFWKLKLPLVVLVVISEGPGCTRSRLPVTEKKPLLTMYICFAVEA